MLHISRRAVDSASPPPSFKVPNNLRLSTHVVHCDKQFEFDSNSMVKHQFFEEHLKLRLDKNSALSSINFHKPHSPNISICTINPPRCVRLDKLWKICRHRDAPPARFLNFKKLGSGSYFFTGIRICKVVRTITPVRITCSHYKSEMFTSHGTRCPKVASLLGPDFICKTY